MHGIRSHPEVLLLVKPEPSPTDTAASAFHILKAFFSEVVEWCLRGEMGVMCDTVSRFKYSTARMAQTGAEVMEYTSLCCYQSVYLHL